MFLPLNFLVRAYELDSDRIIIISNGRPTGIIGGDKLLEGFNVSGNGGMYLYNIVGCQMSFEMEGEWADTEA